MVLVPVEDYKIIETLVRGIFSRIMKLKFFLSVFLVFSICTITRTLQCSEIARSIHDCSIINLIATPEKYHMKKVRLMGYAVIEFENQVLYLSEIDHRNHIYKNGIWLYLEDATTPILGFKGVKGKYVIITGIFDMNMHGHGALNSGGIRRIERLDDWPKELRR